MTLLHAEDLTKIYGRKTVVDGVSLDVDRGEIVGLLGPNGAGKTTTFSMVMGLVRPNSGTITFRDDDITDLAVSGRARRGLGYLAQEPSVFRRLTVRENILGVLEWLPRLSRGEQIDRASRVLADLDLTHLANQRAGLLSGGERRRCELARLLVTEPKLVLLDEPFAGVDPIAVEEIQSLVHGLKARGIATLITDHSVRETLTITDRSYIIHDGRILQHGTAAELVKDERVRRAYLGKSFAMPELEAASTPSESPLVSSAAPLPDDEEKDEFTF